MKKQSIEESLVAPYYTRQNLELILGSNRRTLDYRISKLTSDGVLETIKPGFYLNTLLLSKSSQKEEFIEYVGSIIKYPSYVSLEYALAKYGLIPESIYSITYVTTKKPGKFNSGNFSFKYRNIKEKLFSDYEKVVFNKGEYLFARNYKALFDFIYLTPLRTTSEYNSILFDSRINWENLSKEDKRSFVEICTRSGSKKMGRVVKLLKDKKTL